MMGLQEKKQRLARKIVRAAVDLIGSQGFEAVSLRQVAQQAGVGEATIYRYYPTKYALLYGYYHLMADEVIERLRQVPGFSDYSFGEQLQIFAYTHLDLFEPDREFVKETYKAIFKGGFLHSSDDALELREKGTAILTDLLDAAVEAGEFPEPPAKKFICAGLLDLVVGITIYWVNDDSPEHQRTLQLIDKSAALAESTLQSDLLGGLFDIGQFVFREHVVSLFATSKERNFDFDKIRAQFAQTSRGTPR